MGNNTSNASNWELCYQPLSFPVPIIDTPYCAQGYLCPNITDSDPLTYPMVCPPTIDCQVLRLSSKFCSPQGPYEPVLCPGGFYCPYAPEQNYSVAQIECPAGFYCPLGSFEPLKCPIGTRCPPGTQDPRNFLGVGVIIAIDIILLVSFIFYKYVFEPKGWENRRVRTGLAKQKPGYSHLIAAMPVVGALYRVITSKSKKADANGGPDYSPLTDDSDIMMIETNKKDQLLKSSSGYTDITDDTVESSTLNFRSDVEKRKQEARAIVEAAFLRCNSGLHMELEFDNLSLTLPAPISKTILNNVSGKIKRSRVTAIMGSSGAGKTTFMSVLMGKMNRTAGSIRVNRVESELSQFHQIIGFVPQADIMLDELTVRELLLFSARIRLPGKGWLDSEIQEYVDAVIFLLGLSECADTLASKVSGGQKKRTNIGIELASVAPIIFLDEPTSGLDSWASLEVCNNLKIIAGLGVTVVAVIHQPRLEIFESFDDLLLLAPGGHTVFMGPLKAVIPYFQNIGFVFPPNHNPADDILDFVSGQCDLSIEKILKESSVPEGVETVAHAMTRVWQVRGPEILRSVLSNLGNMGAALSLSMDPSSPGELTNPTLSLNSSEDEYANIDLKALIKGRGAPFLRQLALCHQRSYLQQYRFSMSFLIEMLVDGLAGGIMGLAALALPALYMGVLRPPYTLISPSPIENMLPSIGLFINMAIGLAGAPAGVKTFGEEIAVFKRERAAGHNILAYYTAKSLSMFFRITIGALHFSAIFYVLAKPSQSFGMFFICIWMQYTAVYGFAALVSMFVKREDASLLAVICATIMACLCGYAPSIEQMKKWGLAWSLQLSYTRWYLEAWFTLESKFYERLYLVEKSAEFFGFTLNRVGVDLTLVMVYSLALRVLAFIALAFLIKDKKI